MKILKSYEQLFENKKNTIYKSIKKRDINALKFYIDNGGDVNIIDKSGYSLLDKIVTNTKKFMDFKLEAIQLLLDAGININYHTMTKPPIIFYVNYINIKIIKVLIEYGVDWNITNHTGNMFLEFLDDDVKEELIKLYPEQYKKYIIKKQSNRFNL